MSVQVILRNSSNSPSRFTLRGPMVILLLHHSELWYKIPAITQQQVLEFMGERP